MIVYVSLKHFDILISSAYSTSKGFQLAKRDHIFPLFYITVTLEITS